MDRVKYWNLLRRSGICSRCTPKLSKAESTAFEHCAMYFCKRF